MHRNFCKRRECQRYNWITLNRKIRYWFCFFLVYFLLITNQNTRAYTTHEIHCIHSRFLSSQHSTRVVTSSLTCFVTNFKEEEYDVEVNMRENVISHVSKFKYLRVIIQNEEKKPLEMICQHKVPTKLVFYCTVMVLLCYKVANLGPKGTT